MKNATKKISGVFFLLLGCMPWLFILSFFVQQQTIRHRMKEKLEAAIPKHTIQIPEDQITWVKKEKEIWVNGRMFDIKKMETTNGITTFTGLYDDEETDLRKKFNTGWNKQCDDDNKSLAQMFAYWQAIVRQFPLGEQVWLPCENISFAYIVTRLPQPTVDIATPPPQSC